MFDTGADDDDDIFSALTGAGASSAFDIFGDKDDASDDEE